jgi:hypothetical protein
VARYVRSEEDPETAELGVAVIDDWQGEGVRLEVALPDEGLGAALRQLLRATARGELMARPSWLRRG